jgi:hypothetical protein
MPRMRQPSRPAASDAIRAMKNVGGIGNRAGTPWVRYADLCTALIHSAGAPRGRVRVRRRATSVLQASGGAEVTSGSSLPTINVQTCLFVWR